MCFGELLVAVAVSVGNAVGGVLEAEFRWWCCVETGFETGNALVDEVVDCVDYVVDEGLHEPEKVRVSESIICSLVCDAGCVRYSGMALTSGVYRKCSVSSVLAASDMIGEMCRCSCD